MDENRFEALAGAYGADLRRWPEAERAAAEAFRAGASGRRNDRPGRDVRPM